MLDETIVEETYQFSTNGFSEQSERLKGLTGVNIPEKMVEYLEKKIEDQKNGKN
jgi:hypothetical protein